MMMRHLHRQSRRATMIVQHHHLSINRNSTNGTTHVFVTRDTAAPPPQRQQQLPLVKLFSVSRTLAQDRSLNDISNKILEREIKNREHYHPSSLKTFRNRKDRHLDDKAYLRGTDSFTGLTLNGDKQDEHYFDVHDKLEHDEERAAKAAANANHHKQTKK